jgi:hypothetical protein
LLRRGEPLDVLDAGTIKAVLVATLGSGGIQ